MPPTGPVCSCKNEKHTAQCKGSYLQFITMVKTVNAAVPATDSLHQNFNTAHRGLPIVPTPRVIVDRVPLVVTHRIVATTPWSNFEHGPWGYQTPLSTRFRLGAVRHGCIPPFRFEAVHSLASHLQEIGSDPTSVHPFGTSSCCSRNNCTHSGNRLSAMAVIGPRLLGGPLARPPARYMSVPLLTIPGMLVPLFEPCPAGCMGGCLCIV